MFTTLHVLLVYGYDEITSTRMPLYFFFHQFWIDS